MEELGITLNVREYWDKGACVCEISSADLRMMGEQACVGAGASWEAARRQAFAKVVTFMAECVHHPAILVKG